MEGVGRDADCQNGGDIRGDGRSDNGEKRGGVAMGVGGRGSGWGEGEE